MMGFTLLVQKLVPQRQWLWRTFFLFNILFILCTVKLMLIYGGNKNINQASAFMEQQRALQGELYQELQELLSQKDSNTTTHLISDDNRLRLLLKCHERSFEPRILQRGDYWILENYVRADHGQLKCHESITYTTHGDYTFLDNLIPLLDRWQAPISIALHAPGTDFQPTLNSISYLRNCLPASNLVRTYATFHIYFSSRHFPKKIPKHSDALKTGYNCTLPPAYFNVSSDHLYKTQKHLVYPVNVGRNAARDAALTHFILASDIELYPSPGLVRSFLEMITRNDVYLQRKVPRVFPLAIFEVAADVSVPGTKTELQDYLRTSKAILFHKNICDYCHKVPKFDEWIAYKETNKLGVFHIGKRLNEFKRWEPIYIGTHAEPYYDYRLSWDGRGDKMTQGYALCALNYEFQILDNAFLVHRPGIKKPKKDKYIETKTKESNELIQKVIFPELKKLYGERKGCSVF